MTAETLPPSASRATPDPVGARAGGAARDGHATPPGVPVPASTDPDPDEAAEEMARRWEAGEDPAGWDEGTAP